jgi:hypothetical protein
MERGRGIDDQPMALPLGNSFPARTMIEPADCGYMRGAHAEPRERRLLAIQIPEVDRFVSIREAGGQICRHGRLARTALRIYHQYGTQTASPQKDRFLVALSQRLSSCAVACLQLYVVACCGFQFVIQQRTQLIQRRQFIE